MKVAIDISRMHKLSFDRGIGVYAKNLYEAIKKYTDLEISLVLEKEDLKKYDLIHYPFFDQYTRTLKIDTRIPVVVTVHDLIPVMFPQHYPPGIKGRINWQFQKSEIKKAISIITVSNTVRRDVEKVLKISSEKISVVYSAPAGSFTKIDDKKNLEAIRLKYNLPGEFVLYVGNVNWNKNILNTVQACLDSGKQLVIIGNSFLDKSNLNHPEKKSYKIFLEKYSKNSQIKLLGFVENGDLAIIMNLATVLIFVSFYEGFGLPILEAQACGLPVITSNISATSEISGESAILVDPYNVGEISESINRVFESTPLYQKLVKAGEENVKNYTWKQTAIDTVKVYKNAAG